jgi:LuxR family maltose regulon positive regulatory protein
MTRLPVNVGALLTGRHDPALPLHRWRVNGTLAEVRVADLAATKQEAEQLLELLGLRLTAQEIGRIVSTTEGWIGGIRLAGRAIVSAPSRQTAFETIISPGGILPGYLIEQVIAQLPGPTQQFLRDISVVNPIPVELAQMLTGRTDALTLLREVSVRTGFIAAIDPAERIFRAHQLMSAALRYQLACTAPDRQRRLHKAASGWFLQHQQVVPGIRQALLARDWTRAKELLVADYSRMAVDGRASTIRSLLGQMPPAIVRADPELAAAEMGAYVWMGEFTRGTAELWIGELEDARRRFDSVSATVPHIGFSLPALNSLAHSAWIESLDGRLGAAHDRATTAVAEAERRAWTTVYQVAAAYACLGVIALERGDQAAARMELVRAERAWRPRTELAVGVVIGQLQARLQTAAGRGEEALATLSALRLNPGTRPTTALLDRWVGYAEAEAAAAAGEHDLAQDKLGEAGITDPAVTTLFRARRQLAAGDPPAAVQVLADPATQVPFGRDRAVQVRRMLWLARAHQLIGARQRAVAGLLAALDIARHDGYRAPFHELEGHARPLLELPRADELGMRGGAGRGPVGECHCSAQALVRGCTGGRTDGAGTRTARPAAHPNDQRRHRPAAVRQRQHRQDAHPVHLPEVGRAQSAGSGDPGREPGPAVTNRS